MYLKSYKELMVWQRAISLVEAIYTLTQSFPSTEIYGIISQMRRAAISIPSNIAEGYGRKSSKEYEQFYRIAYGSALELETQLIISKQLKLTHPGSFKSADLLLEEVIKMLHRMLYTMRSKQLDAKR